MDSDTPVDNVRCPRCGEQVVYNGNYFCVNWGSRCDWALSHDDNGDPIGSTDKRIWKEIEDTVLFKTWMARLSRS